MHKYNAFTFLELIIVIVIMLILATITVTSFRSLVDSFSINEVSLTIAQDIRSTQRSAMLLDRQENERWLHGLGVDFRRITQHREYEIFKWCSSFDYYKDDESSISNEVPNLHAEANELYEAELSLDNPTPHCYRAEPDADNAHVVIKTKSFAEHDNLDFFLRSEVAFVLFESVSGKAFFYDENGLLLNYILDGDNLYIAEPGDIERLKLEVTPWRTNDLPSRTIVSSPVSGRIYFEYGSNDYD